MLCDWGDSNGSRIELVWYLQLFVQLPKSHVLERASLWLCMVIWSRYYQSSCMPMALSSTACPEVKMPSACRRIFSGAVKLGLVASVRTYTIAIPSTYDDDIWDYICTVFSLHIKMKLKVVVLSCRSKCIGSVAMKRKGVFFIAAYDDNTFWERR